MLVVEVIARVMMTRTRRVWLQCWHFMLSLNMNLLTAVESFKRRSTRSGYTTAFSFKNLLIFVWTVDLCLKLYCCSLLELRRTGCQDPGQQL